MSPEGALTLPAAGEFSPAMRALDARRQRFVQALLSLPPSRGAQMHAARLAGFGTEASKPRTMTSIASRLLTEERVQIALKAEAWRSLGSAAPRAVSALLNAIEKPQHKHHIRAAVAVLEKVFPSQVEHHVELQDNRKPVIVDAAMIARIVAIAKAVNAPNPTVIDQDVVEVATP